MKILKQLIFTAIAVFPLLGSAQCPDGEVEISLEITTDNWGYEVYWEIVPADDDCGENTIASGGNDAVGCNGGGDQNQTPGGYADNSTISEGPWCVDEGQTYKLVYVDDWGDGGGEFAITVAGFPMFDFEGSGDGNVWTFVASPPPAIDCGILDIASFGYVTTGNLQITGEAFNFGSDLVTDLELQYTVDGGTPIVQTFSGLDAEGFETIPYTFSTYADLSYGEQDITVSVVSVNGVADDLTDNNSYTKTVLVGDPIPNVIDGYIDAAVDLNVINSGPDFVDTPRDLDFHPYLDRFELWVINTGTENSGGSTVTFFDAGFGNQTSDWRQDGNAWHFMSLPTAISFGENQNFATSPGVYDANHDGGQPFTGPSLWSSDPDIYAQPSGGNGSHLDMLHASPYSQGIAHEIDNRYWLVDGHNSNICMYDFVDDHGPGNSYHGDAIIHRYDDVNITKDPQNHVVSHCAFDKDSGWLYVVDYGGQRVIRINTATGVPGGVPAFGPFESIEEYIYITDYEWEEIVSGGLVEPAGIDIIDDRMIVSDYSNGDIVIFDISQSPAIELGRIETESPGIMGLKLGPWGRIWYVNADTDEVVVVEGNPLVVEENNSNFNIEISPNPADDFVTIGLPGDQSGMTIRIADSQGRTVRELPTQFTSSLNVDVKDLSAGTYMVSLMINDRLVQTERLSIY
jgi:hypothetical protein